MRSIFVAILIVLELQGISALHGAEVTWDLLGGIGDFETVTDVRWVSTYTGSNYDFQANSGYASPYSNGSRSGYNLPTPDDTVAAGWLRVTGDTVNPGANIIYRIVNGAGYNGSKCQYLAIKNMSGGTATARIKSEFKIDFANDNKLHPGDTITFRIDHVRMDNYTGLPSGATVSYRVSIGDTGITSSNGYATQVVTPSDTPFSTEVSYVIPSSVKGLAVMLTVETSGNLGIKKPGVYLDGAHLFVKRAGNTNYETREVPVKRDRSITTYKMFYHPTTHDEYSVARDNDVVIFQSVDGIDYSSLLKLKYLNPNIQCYMYITAGTVWDTKDSAGNDLWSIGSPFGMKHVQSNHPEWLYSNGVGGYVNQVEYPYTYLVRVANQAYQNTWANSVIPKTQRHFFDGVFVDDLGTRVASQAGSKVTCVDIAAWEVQQFIHNVFPKLNSAGLKVIRNACNQRLRIGVTEWWWDQLQGTVYFDPFWTPTAPYGDTTKYSANTPDIVGDGANAEYGFWKVNRSETGVISNKYDKSYWLNALDDMDAILAWNTATGARALSADKKKRLYIESYGGNTPDDPQDGIDGWLQFGLCSYLLAQNDWTILSPCVDILGYGIGAAARPDIDLSITKRLGAPDGTHFANVGDAYCRWRRYKATDDGGVGGIVVVNANETASRKY
ncbi:MAG: putative glycoside hydrolase, partial [Armatimonadota bacterium]